MNRFYYFSQKKLKYIEVPHFYTKFTFLFLFSAILISSIVFGGYLTYNEVVNPHSDVKSLKQQNKELKRQLTSLSSQYDDFEKQLKKLDGLNYDLRVAANLDPLKDEDKNFGTGGNIFKDFGFIKSGRSKRIVEDLHKKVEKISAKINFEVNEYNTIETALQDKEILLRSIPAIRPAECNYGDRFGSRMHPILKIKRMHNGLDMLANTGTPVHAPGDGKIEYAGWRGGYGKTIIINHGFGYKTLYAHLNDFEIKKGQKVKRGDLIGHSGNTGRLSTGPHLHYEVKHNGVALNPRNFIFDDVKLFELTAAK